MSLVEIRKSKGLTQKEASDLVGIPYRTYVRYEQNPAYFDNYKYRMIVASLLERTKLDEENGILSLDQIKADLLPILEKHQINYCYLFGSYAKGCPKETSDIDLLVDTDLTGFDFYNLVEEIRTSLHKKIDLVRLMDLKPENPIALEILKEGIRIL